MSMVLGICSALVTVAGKRHTLYVTISTSGYDGWLQQRNCHGIDAVWMRCAARDWYGVDAKGVNCHIKLHKKILFVKCYRHENTSVITTARIILWNWFQSSNEHRTTCHVHVWVLHGHNQLLFTLDTERAKHFHHKFDFRHQYNSTLIKVSKTCHWRSILSSTSMWYCGQFCCYQSST